MTRKANRCPFNQLSLPVAPPTFVGSSLSVVGLNSPHGQVDGG